MVKWKSLLVSWVSQLNLKSAASLSFRQATHCCLSTAWAEGAPGQWKAYSSSHSLQGGSRGSPPEWGQLQALLGWCHRAAQGSASSASSAQAPGSWCLTEEHVCTSWDFCLLQSIAALWKRLVWTGQHFQNDTILCPVLFPLWVRCLKWQNLRKSEGLKPLTSMF